MIKSMTGFGRCEIADEKRKFTVELKSVNHRYLDVNMKMPKKLNFFESAIRSLLKKYIERGKVDLYISYEDYTEDNYAHIYAGKHTVPLSGCLCYGRTGNGRRRALEWIAEGNLRSM